jgi:sulfide dehydrogenase cytochrome subunit
MSRLNRISRLLYLPLLLGSWLATAESASEPVTEPSPPPLLAQACFGCHGPQGRSAAPPIPSLAGLSSGYLLDVLRSYRHGGRFGTVMDRLLEESSSSELHRLADYFARQPAQIPKQRVDWDRAFKGRQLHRLYCRDCHGDLEREPERGTPRLNGQWMDYLRWTLQDYLLGINQADDEMSQALIRIIRRHGNEGLEALVHYYGSARPDR